jgi:anti-sigma-K factor RskA
MIGEDHDRWTDAVGAYLLEAMPEDEREAYELHLESCMVCRAEVDSLRVASNALPASVEQLTPPPALRDRIMAVVEAEAELLASASGQRADLSEPRRRRFSLTSLRPATALAAVVGVLAVGVLVGGQLGQDSGPSTETIAAQVNPDRAQGAQVRLVRTGDEAKLEVRGMPAPPAGRVYQVWLKRAGREAPVPTSALWVPRTDGSASVDVPGSLEDVEAVLVTGEPLGGSDAPTQLPPTITAPLT